MEISLLNIALRLAPLRYCAPEPIHTGKADFGKPQALKMSYPEELKCRASNNINKSKKRNGAQGEYLRLDRCHRILNARIGPSSGPIRKKRSSFILCTSYLVPQYMHDTRRTAVRAALILPAAHEQRLRYLDNTAGLDQGRERRPKRLWRSGWLRSPELTSRNQQPFT